jgi:plastocyanin
MGGDFVASSRGRIMNDVRRPRWPLVAALGIVAGFVAIGSPSPAPAADGARVQMVDNEPDLTSWHFDPAEITVPAGSTVVWFNQGKEDHTVTADNGSFDSGYKKRGASWQRAFPRPGKYAYHCAPHPWMKGTVVVAAGAPAPTSAAAGVGDPASSTTTAPAPAATSTTLSPSLAAPTTASPDTATPAPEETTTPTASGSKESGSDEETSAAPAASRKRSGGRLAATIAVVVLPTLGGLAIGAKLRRSKS